MKHPTGTEEMFSNLRIKSVTRDWNLSKEGCFHILSLDSSSPPLRCQAPFLYVLILSSNLDLLSPVLFSSDPFCHDKTFLQTGTGLFNQTYTPWFCQGACHRSTEASVKAGEWEPSKNHTAEACRETLLHSTPYLLSLSRHPLLPPVHREHHNRRHEGCWYFCML